MARGSRLFPLLLVALIGTLLTPSAAAQTQSHIHAMFTSSPDDAADCHTDAALRTAPPYGFVYASACVLDEAEQPLRTLDSSHWVRWQKSGPVSIYEAATETDGEGRVPVTIRIDGVGDAEITAALCVDLECSTVLSEATLILHAEHQDPPPPECNDGVDNDADGLTDYPNDPACTSPDGEESVRTSQPHWALTIRYDPPRFLGRLFDDEVPCHARQLIRVKKVRPGPDRLIGRDTTDRRGRWEVLASNARGRFYATVRRVTRFEGDRVIACPANRSVTIVLR